MSLQLLAVNEVVQIVGGWLIIFAVVGFFFSRLGSQTVVHRPFMEDLGEENIRFLKEEAVEKFGTPIAAKKLAINSSLERSGGRRVAEPLLYLIYEKGTNGCYKIGISKTGTRITQWIDDGWLWLAVISTRHLSDPVAAAYHVESELLRYYRSVGLCPNPSPPLRMKNGQSETLKTERLAVEDLIRRALSELAEAEKIFAPKHFFPNLPDQKVGDTPGKAKGSIRLASDGTYTAVWEAGQGPDGKRRRKSKSGFVSREEAQKHIDLHVVVTSRTVEGRSRGYVERRPSKKLDNFVVNVYLPRAANGRERTRVLSRWATRKEAEAALWAFSARANKLRRE